MNVEPNLDEALLKRLPLPLAQLYVRAHNAKTAHEQHLNAFYLWEAAIKFLGSVAAVEYLTGDNLDLEVMAPLKTQLAQPTLGNWCQALRWLLGLLADRQDIAFHRLREQILGFLDDDLPQAGRLNELLLEAVEGRRSPRERIRLIELLHRLVDYRHQEIGHGAGTERAAGFHTRLAAALLASFAEVFSRLDVLAGREFILVTQVVDASASECNIEGCLLLGIGSHELLAFKLPSSNIQIRPLQLYLLLEQPLSLVPLAPWLILDVEPDQAVNELFFLHDASEDRRLQYLSYTTGRLLTKELPAEDAFLRQRQTDRGVPNIEPSLPATEVGLSGTAPHPSGGAAPPRLLEKIGEYEVLQLIGRGGMSTVYSAWQPSLGRQVALKVLQRSQHPDIEARFRREIRALGRADHPNLVKIYSSGESETQIYYAMELLEGEPLNKNLAARPMEEAVRLARQAAEGLAALHECGVVHGDMKPGNIMVTPDGKRAILFDLGLAKFVDEEEKDNEPDRFETMHGELFGTPAYMSPEQASGLGRDFRSDVYGLGATLWELLAGRRLYAAQSVLEVLELARLGEPEPLRKYLPQVSADLEAIVHKCLQKDPTKRYSSARQLADDLRRWQDGEPIHARPVSRFEKAYRYLRRRPLVLPIAFLLTFICAEFFAMGLQIRQLQIELQHYKDWYEAVQKGQLVAPRETPDYGTWLGVGFLGVLTLVQGVFVLRYRRLVAVKTAGAQSQTDDQRALMLHPETAEAAAPDDRRGQADQRSSKVIRAPQARPRVRSSDEAFSSQMVVLRYPAPIAIAFRRFCSRKEPRDRLAQLFDSFEITLKYLVYLGLSDLCNCYLRNGPPYGPFPKHQGFDLLCRHTRMTMGQWVQTLRDTSAVLAKQKDRFVAELPEICGEGSYLERDIFRWIGENRNAATHRKGGISLHSEKCAALLAEARPRLEKLFQEIDFVRKYPLGFVTAGYPVGGDRTHYRVHSCMGARVAFGEEVYPMETKVRLPEGVPFVVAPDESAVLCLWPFLLYRESDATQRPSLYVFEEIAKDRQYLTAIHMAAVDHEDEWEKQLHPTDTDDHEWLWAALANLPQTVAVTPQMSLRVGLAESLVGRLSGESLGEGEPKPYKLLGPIAKGGFGTVYDAIDTRTNQRVAVKVLEEREGLEAGDDLAQFRRFHREYEKLRSIGRDAPGIIRCFEWGINIIGRREYPWYSMEFAAGGDLNVRLYERRAELQGKLAWDQPHLKPVLIEEFRAIAGAVAHLHDCNIIHRDVKPANVLILEGGDLRLSDFGLVKDMERPRAGSTVGPGSSRGAVMGTRDYMAPEQARGELATKASDVYALGVVLAELTTGYRPQPSSAVAAGSPIEHDDRVDRLPEALRRLILHCTNVNCLERPGDARYVLHQFERVAKTSN